MKTIIIEEEKKDVIINRNNERIKKLKEDLEIAKQEFYSCMGGIEEEMYYEEIRDIEEKIEELEAENKLLEN